MQELDVNDMSGINVLNALFKEFVRDIFEIGL